MAYTIIANLGEYTTNNNVTNRCNLHTVDNEIMLCEDVILTNYIAESPILTLSDISMAPVSDLNIPVVIITTNPLTYSVKPLCIKNDGTIVLHDNYSSCQVCLNGIVWQVNDKYYNHTIGNVHVTPSSPYIGGF